MKCYSFQAIICVLLCGLSLKQVSWAASSTATLAPSDVESLPVMITTNQSLSVKTSVPIELPPGTAQYAPQLHLEYNSQAPHIAAGELYKPHCIGIAINTTVSFPLRGMSALSCAKLGADIEKYGLHSRVLVKWARAPHSPPILKTALDNSQCFSRYSANTPWRQNAFGKNQCLEMAIESATGNTPQTQFKWSVTADAPPVYDMARSDTPSTAISLSHWSLKGAPFIQPCQYQTQSKIDKHGYHTNLCLVNGQHEQVLAFVGIASNTAQSHNNQQQPAIYRLLDDEGKRLNHLDITLADKTLIINNRLSGEQQVFKQPPLTKQPIYLIKETHIKPFTQNVIRYDWQFVDSPEAKIYRIGKIFYGKNTGVVSEGADSTPEQHFNHTVTFQWFHHLATSYPQFIHIGSRLGQDDKGSLDHDIRYTYNLKPSTIGDQSSISHDVTTGLICTSFYPIPSSPPEHCDNAYVTPLKIAKTPHTHPLYDYFRLSGIIKSNHRSAASRKQRATFFYDTCTTGYHGCLATVIQGDVKQSWAKKRVIRKKTFHNVSLIGIGELTNKSSPFTIDKTPSWTIIAGTNQKNRKGIMRSESKLFEHILTFNYLTQSATNDFYDQTLLRTREHIVHQSGWNAGVITTKTEKFDWSNDGLTQYRKAQFHNDDTGKQHRQQDISTTITYDRKCFDEQQQQLISNPTCDTSNNIAVANRITTTTAVNSDITHNTINYLVAEQVINNNRANTELSRYQCQSSSHVVPVNSNVNAPAVCTNNEKVSVVTYSPITDTKGTYQQVSQDVMRQQHYTTTYTSLGEIQETKHQDQEFNDQPHIVTYKRNDAWRLDAIEDNRSSIKQTFGAPTYTGHPSSQSTYNNEKSTKKLIGKQVITIDPLLLTVNRQQRYAADNTLLEDISYQLLRPSEGEASQYATRTQDHLNNVIETHGYNHQGLLSIASTMASDTKQPLHTTTWEYINQQLSTVREYDNSGAEVSTAVFEYTPLQQLSKTTTTQGKQSKVVNYKTLYHDLWKHTSVRQNNGNQLLTQHNASSAVHQITDSPSTPKTTTTTDYWLECLGTRAYRVITQVIEQGSTNITNKQCFNTRNQLIVDLPQEGLATQYDYYQNHLLKSKTQCGDKQSRNKASCQKPVLYEYYKNDSSPGKAYALKSITTDKQIKAYQYQTNTGYVSDVTVTYLRDELKNAFGTSSSFTTSYSNFDTYGRPLTIDYNVAVSLAGTPIDVTQDFQIKQRYGTGENAHRLEAITYPQSLIYNDSLISDAIPGVVANFKYTTNNKNDPFSEVDLSIDNAPAFKAAAYLNFHELEDRLTYDTPAYKQNYWYNYLSLRNIPKALQCLVTGRELSVQCDYYLAQDKNQKITILDKRVHHLTAGRILFKDEKPSTSVFTIKPAQDYLNAKKPHSDTRYSKSVTADNNVLTYQYPLDHQGDQKSTTYSFNEKDQVIGQYHQLGKKLSHYDYVEGLGYDSQNRLTKHTRDLATNSPTGPYAPRSYFALEHTMSYDAFGNILQSDSRQPAQLNPPNPLNYTNSQGLYDQLSAKVATQLQSNGTPLPYQMPHILPPDKNTQGLVSKRVKNGATTTFDYDNDNQRLTQVMFEPDQFYDGISYGNDTKHIKTHLLYGPDDRVAITIEEQVRDSHAVANSTNHYAISIELGDLYKSRYMYTTPTDDTNSISDFKKFSYSKVPSTNPLSQLVVRHNQTSTTNTQHYSVDVLNYQYDRLGSLIGQRGPVLNSDTPTATGTVEHLVEQRFTPWGRREVLLPSHAPHTSEADTVIALQQQGIDITDSFTGHRSILGSNLLLMGDYRLYDPDSQRFLNPDDRDTGSDISAYNRRMYANNNPVSYVDPDGHTAASLTSFFGRSCCTCSQTRYDDCEMSDEGRVTPLPLSLENLVTVRMTTQPTGPHLDNHVPVFPTLNIPAPTFDVGPAVPTIRAAIALTAEQYETTVRELKNTYGSKTLMIEMFILAASTIGTGVAFRLDDQMGARFGLSLCHASARASLSCAKLLVVTASEEFSKTWAYAIGSMLIFSTINSGTGILVEWNEDTGYLQTDPVFFIATTGIYAGVTSLFDQYTSRYGGLALRWIQYLIKPQGWINPDTRELTPKGKAHGYYAGYMILEPISIVLIGWYYAHTLNNHFGNFPVGPFVGLLSLYTGVRVIGGAMGFEVLLRSIRNRGENYRVVFAELNSRIPTALSTTLITVLAAGKL